MNAIMRGYVSFSNDKQAPVTLNQETLKKGVPCTAPLGLVSYRRPIFQHVAPFCDHLLDSRFEFAPRMPESNRTTSRFSMPDV